MQRVGELVFCHRGLYSRLISTDPCIRKRIEGELVRQSRGQGLEEATWGEEIE